MALYTTLSEIQGIEKDQVARARLMINAASKQNKNTFLSHSSKDNDLVPGAILILENHGGRVYVDLGDERLPEPPSTETANILRRTIREMRRFVLLVSPRSNGSTWIPWELGLADGEKGIASVALFPVVQSISESTWTEKEYLGLYSRVAWGRLQGYTDSVWMVLNHHTNTATELSEWLAGY